jgi:DNA (cytosine-5)-methyltransferase 1
MTKTYRIAELFTGTGAFSLAFHTNNKVKYEVVYANDIDASSKVIYDANNNLALHCEDIMKVSNAEIPSMDILTCGFPCQPFSIAGKQDGFNDTRSNVFWKICEVLEHHKPRIAILENVKNLQGHDNGMTFEIIQGTLEELGYNLKYTILNTCITTNIPQNRERIYIVCFRDIADYSAFSFPSEVERSHRLSIKELLEDNVPDKYYYKKECVIWEKLSNEVKQHIDTNTVYQYRRYYVRENKNGVCPTLTANMGTGGHNVPIIMDDRGIRKLTPKECFRLQGFPASYVIPELSDAKLYKLAGNAVSVPVVLEIIKKLPL